MKINLHPAYLLAVAAIFVALLAGWLVRYETSPKQKVSAPDKTSATRDDAAPTAKATDAPAETSVARGMEIDNRPPKQPPAQVSSVAGLVELLRRAAQRLADPSLSADEVRQLLQDLRNALFSSEPALSVQAILEFLGSGADATTSLGFDVGPGGTLLEAPTMRVALLDWLGQLNISAAEAYSQQWLDQPRNSGEWAILLRNAAWADPDQAHAHRLVDRLTWTLDSTDWPVTVPPGYLEVFDLLPRTGDPALFARLAELSGDPQESALSWAAFLAMDRTVLSNPDRFLTTLASTPALLGENPAVRASFMARADVRSKPQREALEMYLRRQEMDPAEANVFASLFPNYNLVAGYRLFTPADSDGASLAEYAERDRAAFELLDTWEKDASLAPSIRQALPHLRSRLAEHVESARRAEASGELNREP